MSHAYSVPNFTVTFPSPHVAQVEISRPEKLNAFTTAMFHGIGAIFRRLSEDPDVRAVVLTSQGDRAFSAGLDVQDASAHGPLAAGAEPLDVGRRAVRLMRHVRTLQDDISAIERCEKPVIAVLHGIALGLALDIATCCDVRICSADVRLSVREVDIGLAADIGTLSRLPRSGVPMSWVKDVVLTGRDFFAHEAMRVGFVSEACESKGDALERAREMARCIAGKSPVAVQGTKEVVNYSRDHGVAEGLNYVKVWNASMLQTEDVKSAMLAGLKRQRPTFAKL